MNIIITESQHQTFLLETISTYLRRRMSMDVMKGEMDAIIEYHIFPCEFKNAGDFVAEACDMMTYGYLEDINVSAEDTDSFYYHMVDLFGDYLVNHYNKKCSKKLRTESVRKIIITESQFEQIIPNSVRRRLSEISDVLYEMLNNTDIGEEAEEYPEDDYVDYVIEILLPEVISEIDWSDVAEYEEIFKKLVGDKIRKFWKEQNQDSLNESEDEGIDRESLYVIMDDIVDLTYGGFNITEKEDYVTIYRKGQMLSDNSKIAHRNKWGMLWLKDINFVKHLTNYFSFDTQKEREDLVMDYLRDRYGVNVRQVEDVSKYVNY